MSLNDLMSSLNPGLFLSLDKFGEQVIFYKGADFTTGVPVTVIWDADAIPGTNEVDGDGVVLDKRSGRRERQSIKVECDRSLNVDENADPPDRFVRGDDVALVKRIVGYDSGGLMTVLCIRNDGKYDRGKYRMG